MLLIVIASMGAFLVLYSVFRHITGVGFGDAGEKYMMDIIMIGALGLFMYNRKMASDERKAKEAALEAERRAAEGYVEPVPEEDENLPHWKQKNQD